MCEYEQNWCVCEYRVCVCVSMIAEFVCVCVSMIAELVCV